MAGKVMSLFVDIVGRDKGASKVLDAMADKAQTAHKGVEGWKKGLDSAAVPAAGFLAAVGGIAIGFGNVAAEAEQTSGAIETVFGKAAGDVEKYASRSAKAVGLSGSAYNELSATIGTNLKMAGFSVDQLADKNNMLIERGADMASVFGGTTAEAVQAMGSAFRGEFDPLERYGVQLTANKINAELAARGLDGLTGAAAESAKKQVTLDLIMQGSAQTAGNFAKETDTAKNQQQKATAAWEDASAKLGTALLPMLTKLAETFSTVASWVAENSQLVTVLIGIIAGLAAGIVTLNVVMGIANIVMMPQALLIGGITLAIMALIAVIALLVMNWDKVVKFLQDSWQNFTRWFTDGMGRIGQQWNDFWGGVGRVASDIWRGTLGPVFDTIRDMVQNKVPGAFSEGVKWIAVHWNKIQEIAKAPVRFLVNTVINDGLIGTFNTVAGWVGLGQLGRVGLPPGFAGGGFTGDGDKWEPAGVVHKGEYVFTKEQTKKAGVSTLARIAKMFGGYADGGFVNPLPNGVVSSPYGPRIGGFHNGIDLAAPYGTPIHAAFGGNVTFAQWSPFGGGNEIHIQHAGGWETWYAHMSNFLTRAGQTVNRGQSIGLVGSSGDATGPHLHYMVLKGGWPNYVDPTPYMSGVMPPGAINPLAGIMDNLIGGLTATFKTGQLATDLAVGFGKKLIGDVSDKVGKSLGFGNTGGPQLFDSGGWMSSVGVNKTGLPEAVLTSSQWDDIHRLATRGMDLSGYTVRLNADATMLTFERMADDAVSRANEDIARGRAR